MIDQELHDLINFLEDAVHDISKWSAYHEDFINDEVASLENIISNLRVKEEK